jgi:hypothetical protein
MESGVGDDAGVGCWIRSSSEEGDAADPFDLEWEYFGKDIWNLRSDDDDGCATMCGFDCREFADGWCSVELSFKVNPVSVEVMNHTLKYDKVLLEDKKTREFFVRSLCAVNPASTITNVGASALHIMAVGGFGPFRLQGRDYTGRYNAETSFWNLKEAEMENSTRNPALPFRLHDGSVMNISVQLLALYYEGT